MKKSSFILSVVSALVVTVIPAGAQIQNVGARAATKETVKLSKGTYQTVSLNAATGVTPTVTGTVSGTVASLNVAGSYLMASVSTTITSTLKSSDFIKGKVDNKTLLSLIFNTTNSKTFAGYTPVLVSVGDSMLSGGTAYIGARKGKDTNVLVRTWTANPDQGVNAAGTGEEYYLTATPSKKNPNQVTRTGYGYAGVSIAGPLNGVFTKSTNATWFDDNVWSSQYAKFKETIFVNPAGTAITNTTGGSLQ